LQLCVYKKYFGVSYFSNYLDIEKHNAQYEAIEVKEFKQSHDRFLIIDETEIYHFGASLKDLGKKLVVSKAESMVRIFEVRKRCS
jgi:hypothetical protein